MLGICSLLSCTSDRVRDVGGPPPGASCTPSRALALGLREGSEGPMHHTRAVLNVRSRDELTVLCGEPVASTNHHTDVAQVLLRVFSSKHSLLPSGGLGKPV